MIHYAPQSYFIFKIIPHVPILRSTLVILQHLWSLAWRPQEYLDLTDQYHCPLLLHWVLNLILYLTHCRSGISVKLFKLRK